MTAKEFDKLVMDEVSKTDFGFLLEHTNLVGIGQIKEIYNQSGRDNQYYQWLHCAMKVLRPRQVVELGAAAGISTIMMATGLPKDSKLISVDCDPTAWKWMNREYPQVVKILGDELDLSIYKDIDLFQTRKLPDFWFFDSLHTPEQLTKELELYRPFFKQGAVLAFDDIRLPGMYKVWEDLPYDKIEITDPCHYSGFGIAIR